jgi:hypothetical protein
MPGHLNHHQLKDAHGVTSSFAITHLAERALPFSGAWVTATLSRPACTPVTAFLRAPGCAWTGRRIPSDVDCRSINKWSVPEVTLGLGDKERGRQGDWEMGDKEIRRLGEARTDGIWPAFCLLVSLSPHLLVWISPSPCLPIPLSGSPLLLVWPRVSRPTLELFP